MSRYTPSPSACRSTQARGDSASVCVSGGCSAIVGLAADSTTDPAASAASGSRKPLMSLSATVPGFIFAAGARTVEAAARRNDTRRAASGDARPGAGTSALRGAESIDAETIDAESMAASVRGVASADRPSTAIEATAGASCRSGTQASRRPSMSRLRLPNASKQATSQRVVPASAEALSSQRRTR